MTFSRFNFRSIFTGAVCALAMLCLTAPSQAQVVDNESPFSLPAEDTQPGAPAPPADAQHEARTPLVRKMLDELDAPDNAMDADERAAMRRMLLDADDELYLYTGENARQMVLRANQRRPALQVRHGGSHIVRTVISGPNTCRSYRPARPAPPQRTPEVAPPAENPNLDGI